MQVDSRSEVGVDSGYILCRWINSFEDQLLLIKEERLNFLSFQVEAVRCLYCMLSDPLQLSFKPCDWYDLLAGGSSLAGGALGVLVQEGHQLLEQTFFLEEVNIILSQHVDLAAEDHENLGLL